MARVTVEDCIDKVDNRFELVLMASHRARAISSGAHILVARDNDKNPVVALREIADFKLSPDDLKEDLIHALQKQVEVDEPEAEAAPPARATRRLARSRRRGAVRPHDRGRLLRGLEGMAPPPEPEDDARVRRASISCSSGRAAPARAVVWDRRAIHNLREQSYFPYSARTVLLCCLKFVCASIRADEAQPWRIAGFGTAHASSVRACGSRWVGGRDLSDEKKSLPALAAATRGRDPANAHCSGRSGGPGQMVRRRQGLRLHRARRRRRRRADPRHRAAARRLHDADRGRPRRRRSAAPRPRLAGLQGGFRYARRWRRSAAGACAARAPRRRRSAASRSSSSNGSTARAASAS